MLGSIIGDIAGSIYEFDNIKTKNFPLFLDEKSYTDDSILTLATAEWLLRGGDAGEYYMRYAREHPGPMGGYGNGFLSWVHRGDPRSAYFSCGNGSAMRVGPVGWAFGTEEETLAVARKSAECTHNHPEGIKGAQATALCIFLARKDIPKQDIRQRIERDFGYDLSLPVEEIRRRYSWKGLDGKGNGGTCQDSVPQAIACALQSVSFEDAVRNAVSIGGDSDTIGCITGSIAEALYGIPREIRQKGLDYLPEPFKKLVLDFENKYGRGQERAPKGFKRWFKRIFN